MFPWGEVRGLGVYPLPNQWGRVGGRLPVVISLKRGMDTENRVQHNRKRNILPAKPTLVRLAGLAGDPWLSYDISRQGELRDEIWMHATLVKANIT